MAGAPEPWLEAAQDDATRLAIADMQNAGIDIITDGEIRRESYSNRFATAPSGVDLDDPAGRHRRRRVVPRITGPIRVTRMGDPRARDTGDRGRPRSCGRRAPAARAADPGA